MYVALDITCFLGAAFLLLGIACDPPHDFKEGVKGAKDVMFSDCTYDVKGNTGMRLIKSYKWSLKTTGAVYTYIELSNLKPADQQGNVTKTSGGVGSNYVEFQFVSIKGHGFKFQLKSYGTTPAGKTEPFLSGTCGP